MNSKTRADRADFTPIPDKQPCFCFDESELIHLLQNEAMRRGKPFSTKKRDLAPQRLMKIRFQITKLA